MHVLPSEAFNWHIGSMLPYCSRYIRDTLFTLQFVGWCTHGISAKKATPLGTQPTQLWHNSYWKATSYFGGCTGPPQFGTLRILYFWAEHEAPSWMELRDTSAFPRACACKILCLQHLCTIQTTTADDFCNIHAIQLQLFGR